jgi:BlaI family transcriptional regulator, penicillinase repressor
MRTRGELPALSEVQLEIMHEIWERGECSVGEVWRTLHERRGVSRNTIHTLIVRLEEKGWLKHREADGAFLYSATVSREAAQQQKLRTFIDTVFAGSAEGLVLAMLQGGSLSPEQAERIRRMITTARRRKS